MGGSRISCILVWAPPNDVCLLVFPALGYIGRPYLKNKTNLIALCAGREIKISWSVDLYQASLGQPTQRNPVLNPNPPQEKSGGVTGTR